MTRSPSHSSSASSDADTLEIVLQKSARVLRARAAVANLREQLAAAEVELRAAESDLAATFTAAPLELVSEEPQTDESDEAGEDSERASPGARWRQVVELIDASPDVVFTAADVCARLDLSNLPSTRTMLAKLAHRGHVARVGNGQYASLKAR